tara:strand:- start:13145 stop:14944 length:1800 start_codon:yes stop_codon:yes gene_type:complete
MPAHGKLNTVKKRIITYSYSFFLILLIGLSSTAFAQQASDLVAPEQGHNNPSFKQSEVIKPEYASEFIAVTAHPLASQAAYAILNKGGSVMDAMVTAQTVLGLVEPQSSGLGGGAFTLFYDAQKQILKTFDGRETAPLASSENLFMSDETSPMQFFEAVVGGRSVGTPGTVKLLWELHKQYGKLEWSEVLQPAINMATQGFRVTPRLAQSVMHDSRNLKQDPEAAAYFLPHGSAIQTGDILKNPAYADTLAKLAKHGGDYFYDSEISKAIIDKVSQSSNKGLLSQADFDSYKLIERSPICSAFYRYKVCGMGPPSSGAIAVGQILSLVEHKNIHAYDSEEPLTWQIIAEASQLAFADRGQYLADPDFFNVPQGLLDNSYLKKRSLEITPSKKNKNISFGYPPGYENKTLQRGNSPEQESTSHFVLVDKTGNIISMTSTIENGFGSRLMVKGFLLNNELTDFSFSPTKGGSLVANRVEAGKRPRSSMAPTIVFKNDKPYLALGSPGGSRIINFVAHALIRVLAWNENLQQAFNQAHIINRFGRMEIEQNTHAASWQAFFEKRAYTTVLQDINSGLHGVHFTEKGMAGAADKRREGVVIGK